MDSFNTLKMIQITNKFVIIHDAKRLIFSGFVDESQIWTNYTVKEFDTQSELDDYITANQIVIADEETV